MIAADADEIIGLVPALERLTESFADQTGIDVRFESGLADGVMFERRMFHALFATEDQKEGMDAFVNKRKAAFKHR